MYLSIKSHVIFHNTAECWMFPFISENKISLCLLYEFNFTEALKALICRWVCAVMGNPPDLYINSIWRHNKVNHLNRQHSIYKTYLIDLCRVFLFISLREKKFCQGQNVRPFCERSAISLKALAAQNNCYHKNLLC